MDNAAITTSAAYVGSTPVHLIELPPSHLKPLQEVFNGDAQSASSIARQLHSVCHRSLSSPPSLCLPVAVALQSELRLTDAVPNTVCRRISAVETVFTTITRRFTGRVGSNGGSDTKDGSTAELNRYVDGVDELIRPWKFVEFPTHLGSSTHLMDEFRLCQFDYRDLLKCYHYPSPRPLVYAIVTCILLKRPKSHLTTLSFLPPSLRDGDSVHPPLSLPPNLLSPSLVYRSHQRGMLELDLLVGRWTDTHRASLSDSHALRQELAQLLQEVRWDETADAHSVVGFVLLF